MFVTPAVQFETDWHLQRNWPNRTKNPNTMHAYRLWSRLNGNCRKPHASLNPYIPCSSIGDFWLFCSFPVGECSMAQCLSCMDDVAGGYLAKPSLHFFHLENTLSWSSIICMNCRNDDHGQNALRSWIS